MGHINEKVLVVDDDQTVLKLYRTHFEKVVNIFTAASPSEGLEKLEEDGPFALLVADYKLPEMNGLELISKANQIAPDMAKILLTGHADLELAIKAINEGRVFRFLTKPCSNKTMAAAFIDAINFYRSLKSEKDTLERTFNGCVQMLTDVISLSTPAAFGRARKLKALAGKMAEPLKIHNPWEFKTAAIFTQLGYVTLPHQLLEKIQMNIEPTDVELQMLANVPVAGERLLKNIPRLERIARIVRYSEKNYDGSGYPADDVALKDLPLESRALKILSTICRLEEETEDFDIITANIREKEGLFDPEIAEAILKNLEPSSFAQIHDEIEVLKINIEDLKIGDILLSDVITADDKLIFSLGNEVTPVILTKLLNYAEITEIKQPITIKRKI